MPKLRLPRIKIVNIMEKFSAEQITDLLIRQNTVFDDDANLKVLHVMEVSVSTNRPRFSAFLEVNGNCFEKLMTLGFVNLG